MSRTDQDTAIVHAALDDLAASTTPTAVVAFRLGGVEFDLRVPADLAGDLETWYDEFQCEPTGGVDLRFHWIDDVAAPAREAFLEMTDRYRHVQVIAESPALAPGEIAVLRWDFRCIVRADLRRVDAVLVTRSAASADAVARVAASLIMPTRNQLLVHAASVAHDGRGYVFTGVSGSGKSTLSANSGGTILNDEISLISIEEHGVRVHGTPFYGSLKISHNQQAPLTGLFILTKAPTTFVEPIKREEQAGLFLRNVISFRVDLDGFDMVHRVTEQLLDRCPLQRLHFERDVSVLGVVAK